MNLKISSLSLFSIFFACLTCIFFNSHAQPLIEFQRSYGGSEYDRGSKAIQNSNGGFTLAGTTFSSDGQVTGSHSGLCSNSNVCPDFWIINTDSIGNIVWKNCFGGYQYDYCHSITPATNGASIACGYTRSDDDDISDLIGYDDAWVLMLDSLGNLVWQKCFGGSAFDEAYDIISTNDGNYMFCGSSNSIDHDLIFAQVPSSISSDIWVLKFDSLGNMLWNRAYGGTNADYGHSIVQTLDGGYAFLGVTESSDIHFNGSGFHGFMDFVLGKISSSGDFLWAKCYGGSDIDEGFALQQTPDSGFIMVGKTKSIDGQVSSNHDSIFGDIWVVKTDKLGNLEWEKCLGGIFWDEGSSVIVLEDSTYLISGTVGSFDGDVTNNHGGEDHFLVKLDYTGQIIWSQCYGGYDSDQNGGIIQTETDRWVMFGSSSHNSGDVSGNHGSYDMWLLKLYEPSPIEASIILDSIDQSCTLSDSENVKIRIANLGEYDFYNFPVSYSVNGAIPVSEIIADTLHPGDTLHYTFQTTADLSIPGIYNLHVSVNVSGDAHAFNDSTSCEVVSIEHLTVPWSMGFEDHEIFTGWYSYDLDADGYSGEIVPYSPHSGDKTYVFWPAYTLVPHNQLWTPCIDLNASTDYLMSYWMKGYSSQNPYSLEVYINSTPDLLGSSLISSPQIPIDTSYHQIFAPFNISQSGTYYVCFKSFATDLTSLLGIDDIMLDFNTGISGLEKESNPIIFPNPAGEFLSIQGMKSHYEIKVYDLLGNLLIQKTTSNVKESISLKNLVPGMYLIEIDNSKRWRFIKE
ncbi:MAG TPA: T9SS type A sorting domain-containing protein [Bacteroidia bacterium]|nr:T9SS type A sorting domain-containing protein [Bacteroidia bacterium]